MTQHWFEALSDDVGGVPSNISITPLYGSLDTLEVHDDSTGDQAAIPHLEVVLTGGGDNPIAKIDSIDGVSIPDSEDVEIYLSGIWSGSGNAGGLIARVTSFDDVNFDFTGYYNHLDRQNDEHRVRRAEDSRFFRTDGQNIETASHTLDFIRYGLVLTASGSSINSKLWGHENSDESQAQEIGGTDSAVTGTGPVGVGRELRNTSFASIYIYGLGIGTGGDSAPRSASDVGPSDPPQGTVTIDGANITTTDTSATVPFSYDDTDAEGYEYRLDDGSAVDIGIPDPLEANPTGLTADTQYQIEVRAYNSEGESAWSSPETFTTDQAAAPDLQVSVRLVDPDGGYRTDQAGLGWSVYTARPGQTRTLISEGASGTTDTDGWFEYQLTEAERDNNNLSDGDVVWLEITSSDGQPSTNSWTVGHPVALETV